MQDFSTSVWWSSNIRKQSICNRSADIVKKEKKKPQSLVSSENVSVMVRKGVRGWSLQERKKESVPATYQLGVWFMCAAHRNTTSSHSFTNTFLTNSQLAVYFGQFKHLQDAFSVFFIASQIAKIFFFTAFTAFASRLTSPESDKLCWNHYWL